MSQARAGRTRDRVFRFVRDRLLAGDPPTVREVQQMFGFRTPHTARYHLEKLVAERKLSAARGRARGYRLPAGGGSASPAGDAVRGRGAREDRLPGGEPAAPVGWVPLLGRVEAGRPTEAVEDVEGYVPVPADRAGAGLFALRVQGQSMVGAGILPGDLVIVRPQPTADSGALVVALVDGEATVKRLRRRGGRVELHPENPEFAPIRSDREITLLGKVLEVRRTVG